METIRRSDKIYAWAHEYHVMGFGTFKRGWCLMELGVTKATPILYTEGDGLRDDAADRRRPRRVDLVVAQIERGDPHIVA